MQGDGLFMEWAVGKYGDEMRPGSGRLMLPGSSITWEMHYHAVGEEITSHTELAVWFYPKGEEPKHREVLGLFNTFSAPPGVTVANAQPLDIPPNSVVTTENFVTLRENARIENFQAHMHLRGKGMSMEAMYPDGKRETLSQVSDFNFNWHNMYIYATKRRRSCRRGRSSTSSRGTTTPRTTRSTRIPISGSAGAIARLTRWATPG